MKNFFRHLHEMSQPSGQDQQNGKRTYCQLPPQPFRINFKDTHFLIFLWTPKGFIFSLECFLNFYKPVLAPWQRKYFKFVVLRLLENAFVSQKLNLLIFTYFPKQKYLPGSYHYHCRQEEVNHFRQTTFFYISSAELGRRIMELKK